MKADLWDWYLAVLVGQCAAAGTGVDHVQESLKFAQVQSRRQAGRRLHLTPVFKERVLNILSGEIPLDHPFKNESTEWFYHNYKLNRVSSKLLDVLIC